MPVKFEDLQGEGLGEGSFESIELKKNGSNICLGFHFGFNHYIRHHLEPGTRTNPTSSSFEYRPNYLIDTNFSISSSLTTG